MADLKHIAATLAVLGTAAFSLTACKKDSTEAPGGGAAAGEKSCGGANGCGGHKAGDKAEGDKTEGDKAAGEAPAEGAGEE
jgi:hypothetical protein